MFFFSSLRCSCCLRYCVFFLVCIFEIVFIIIIQTQRLIVSCELLCGLFLSIVRMMFQVYIYIHELFHNARGYTRIFISLSLSFTKQLPCHLKYMFFLIICSILYFSTLIIVITPTVIYPFGDTHCTYAQFSFDLVRPPTHQTDAQQFSVLSSYCWVSRTQ